MDSQIKYRRMKPDDAAGVSEFIWAVFNQYVAPEFSQEGIDEFGKHIQPEAIKTQLREKSFGFVAILGSETVGVIEVRNHSHVALFFVNGRFQGKGIGKSLLRKALELCGGNNSNLAEITVNASINSTMVYEALGFQPTGSEKRMNGIRFVPMVLSLKRTQ